MRGTGRLVGILFLLDLFLAALALGAYRLWVYPEQRPLFLLLVNVNMLLCALAALAGAVVLWRARDEAAAPRARGSAGQGSDPVFSWLLLITMGTLLAGEVFAFVLEFLPGPGVGVEVAVSLTSRLAVVALAFRAAWLPLMEQRAPWAMYAKLGLFVAGVMGVTLVAFPLWLDGHSAHALLAGAEVLALLQVGAALRRGGVGSPATAPARFFSLAGLSLYLVTDLSYLRHMGQGDESFCLAEIGFYAAYLMVAWGTVRQASSGMDSDAGSDSDSDLDSDSKANG